MHLERISWKALHPQIMRSWEQGQHFHVSGATGEGKTFVLRQILPRRKNVVIFGSKIEDDEYNNLLRDGFRRVYGSVIPPDVNRALVWPKEGRTIQETMQIQRDTFKAVFDRIWKQRKWTIVWEEMHWLANELGMDTEIKMAHHVGRSMGITNVDGMQRAMNVPVIVHGSASHAVMFRTSEDSDLKRMSGLGGLSSRQLAEANNQLTPHEFIYLPTRGQGMKPVISKVGT